MAKSGSSHTDFGQLRQRLLALSKKQTELRQRLADHLNDNGTTIGAVARKADVTWSSLKGFSEGQVCLSSGRGLQGLCRLLDCADLGSEISALAAGVGDRYLGLANRSPETIRVALDLIEAYQDRVGQFTSGEFAGAFGEHSSTVLGVLNGSQPDQIKLEDAEVREFVLNTLISNLDDQLEKSKSREDSKKLAAAEKLRELAQPLIEQLGGQAILAQALGCARTNLYRAMTGKASLEQTQRLIGKAEKLSAPHQAAPSENEPIERLKALYPDLLDKYGTKQKVADAIGIPRSTLWDVLNGKRDTQLEMVLEKFLQDLAAKNGQDAIATESIEVSAGEAAPQAPARPIEDFAGVTTGEGVPHVLTEESFTELEKVPLMALRDSLRTALRLARMQLNIGSQLRDKTAREILQKEIGKELQELETAIRLFTFAHPNRLLELYDSQRQVWTSDQSKKTQTRKGA